MEMLPLAEPSASGPGFDYAALPDDVGQRQRDRAAKIGSIYRRTVEAAGEIGRELIAAQDELEHGTFLRWVEGALGLSKSSAYRFMDVARSFGEKLPVVGSLPMTVVHKLAERSTPEPVPAAVLRRIEAGETITPDAILNEVREGKGEAKKRAAAEREAARRAALTDEQRADEDLLKSRSEKGKAARERKEERERQERDELRRLEGEAAARGAAWLVSRLGADDAAAFFATYAESGAIYRIMGHAKTVADIERGQDVPPVEIEPRLVERNSYLSGFHWHTSEEREEIAAETARIRDGGAVEPMTVRRLPGPRELYELLDHKGQFRALVDELRHPTVPVRIVPPAAPLSDA